MQWQSARAGMQRLYAIENVVSVRNYVYVMYYLQALHHPLPIYKQPTACMRNRPEVGNMDRRFHREDRILNVKYGTVFTRCTNNRRPCVNQITLLWSFTASVGNCTVPCSGTTRGLPHPTFLCSLVTLDLRATQLRRQKRCHYQRFVS